MLSMSMGGTTGGVELRGIEPLTFSMRTRRATNCAIAPGGLLAEPLCHCSKQAPQTPNRGPHLGVYRPHPRGPGIRPSDSRPGGAADITTGGAVADGAGGGGVIGLEMLEHRILVVGFE